MFNFFKIKPQPGEIWFRYHGPTSQRVRIIEIGQKSVRYTTDIGDTYLEREGITNTMTNFLQLYKKFS